MIPVEGTAFRGELTSIDTSGRATFREVDKNQQPDKSRTLALDEIVRWGNPVAPRPQTIVVLADGGQLVTVPDWVGGAAVRLIGDDVVVQTEIWNEVRIPRGLVSGVVFAQQDRPEKREQLVEHVRNQMSASRTEQVSGNTMADVVMLTNDDRLTGNITGLDRGSLTMETLGKAAKLPLSRVDAVRFGTKRQLESRPGQDGYSHEIKRLAIGLRDGSLLYAKAIRANENELAVELANGVKLTGRTVHDVVAIQSLDRRIVYPSDMNGADYRSVPYLTIKWPYTRDHNVLGEPIVVRGKRYLKGIGMHSASRLTFRFDQDYRQFDAAVAIDDSAKGGGSVTFGLYVLRHGKWTEAYQSGVMRGSDEPRPVSVDLTGARGLTLTVDFADRGDELDHAVWLDARLVR
ncbi:MAG TPA: NPCBM/NEW2 domain-containing protein [Lacipirellulaceae bacterium]|nr:NPCBM/NEW2 domain-containing protein [Lacipirellulaceae bacterium]